MTCTNSFHLTCTLLYENYSSHSFKCCLNYTSQFYLIVPVLIIKKVSEARNIVSKFKYMYVQFVHTIRLYIHLYPGDNINFSNVLILYINETSKKLTCLCTLVYTNIDIWCLFVSLQKGCTLLNLSCRNFIWSSRSRKSYLIWILSDRSTLIAL